MAQPTWLFERKIARGEVRIGIVGTRFQAELKAWNSRRASPRPMPSRSRPPEIMSSTIAFSATRSGLFHGTITAAVPISMFGHSAARCVSTCKLSGQNE